MIKLHVDKKGTIGRAVGNTDAVFGMSGSEIEGLPITLFIPDLSSKGLHTQVIRGREGQEAPVHLAFLPGRKGCEIWATQAFGEEQVPLKLSLQRTLFQSLAFATEFGDPGLRDHLHRVSTSTAFLARHDLELDEAGIERLAIAALVHDIGKAAIPRELLFKPGRFLDEERRFMQAHCEKGCAIIEEVEAFYTADAAWMVDEETFRLAKEITLHHHENWDGTGYPKGKQGEDIPISARIVKLADVIDALLEARPYKPAWSWGRVRREIQRLSGVEFDPRLAEWFLRNETLFLAENCAGGLAV